MVATDHSTARIQLTTHTGNMEAVTVTTARTIRMRLMRLQSLFLTTIKDTEMDLIKTGDRVIRKSNGKAGTVDKMIVDHVALVVFYAVQFDNGDFETFSSHDLSKVQC